MEGEKDADRLASLGLVATTNSGGAGKWPKEFGPYFDGRKVAILPDNDPPGKANAQMVAESVAPYASVAKVVELSGLPEKGDVSDWLNQGHAIDELLALVEEAPNLTSDGIYGAIGSEVAGLLTRVNAAALQEEAWDPNRPHLEFLPLLGRDGFFIRGFSHLFSGFPKSGKTTLLAPQVLAWSQAGVKVLYLAEEPKLAWLERLERMPGGWENVSLIFALGSTLEAIMPAITEGEEEVVVIDTVRLLGLEDENDNALINRALTPLVALCRSQGKTFILAHHTRKMGGEHGMAAAGGHALVGLVDIVLELLRDPQATKRRKVRGWGRIVEVPELLYELQDGELVALGDPQDVALEEVKARLREALTEEWQKTEELRKPLGEPQPSSDQVLKALDALARAGEIERDPPLAAGPKPGARYKWRLNLTSDDSIYTIGGEVSSGGMAEPPPLKSNGHRPFSVLDQALELLPQPSPLVEEALRLGCTLEGADDG